MPKSKIKGAGTTKKVCLPYDKYKSMSKAERQKLSNLQLHKANINARAKPMLKVHVKKALHLEIGFKKNDGLISQMVSPAEKSKYNLINSCQSIY